MTGPAKSTGRLEQVFRAGRFAVTAETTPPVTTDLAAALAKALPLRSRADAVNVTDGAGAKAHLSSLVLAGQLARDGIEPVLQLTGRDRNRIALQADVLGAAALGVPNVLCLSGDPVTVGDEPEATPVNDLDSAGLVALIARMRDEGRLNSGREISGPPRLLIAVADMPFDPPADWAPDGLARKIAAGADFVQTQYCFDPALCRRYMARLQDHGITEMLPFLIGIGPLASGRQARWMRENLPGVDIPDEVVARLDQAPDPRAEGRRICIDLMQQYRDIPGVAGVHMMAPGQEASIAQAIEESGIRSP